MRGQNMGDFILVFIKCIINVEDRAARITEHRVYPLLFQAFNDNLCSCQCLHLSNLLSFLKNHFKCIYSRAFINRKSGAEKLREYISPQSFRKRLSRCQVLRRGSLINRPIHCLFASSSTFRLKSTCLKPAMITSVSSEPPGLRPGFRSLQALRNVPGIRS